MADRVEIIEALLQNRGMTLHGLMNKIRESGYPISWSTLHRCFYSGDEIPDGTKLGTIRATASALGVRDGDIIQNSGDQYTRELIAGWLGCKSPSLKAIENQINRLKGDTANGTGNTK